ncbi:type II secretion system protein M [Sphingomonas sp. R-74633]|uniref:type II secretion system protein GspM n=1 Tax=Sphingomonas sp. R-74633 TaxID=2751188 RepID=UPI0015D44DF7|nr:type II secretion system protein GspM [Sphingomonas sp. R-74633]NYT42054.1 type II secretion system protein M [Sphingomonas sp. R-74633]
MRLILARMPALDAALIRFDAWWSGLSRRERFMVGGLALFLAALVLVYGVVKPLQSARASALQDIRTYETLTARIRAAGTLSANQPQRRQGSPADVITGSAPSFGLTTTVAPLPGGARATVADGSYDSVLAWLADLSATSSLRIQRVDIQRTATPGRVSAVVDFGA